MTKVFVSYLNYFSWITVDAPLVPTSYHFLAKINIESKHTILTADKVNENKTDDTHSRRIQCDS